MKNLHDTLTTNRFAFIRHIGYFLASIGMAILWIILMIYTAVCSIIWLTIEKGAFTLTWIEFWDFTKKFWNLPL